jgi:hypothetical protein
MEAPNWGRIETTIRRLWTVGLVQLYRLEVWA